MKVRLIKKDSQLFGRSAFFECPVYYYQIKKYGIWWTEDYNLSTDIGPNWKYETAIDWFKSRIEQTIVQNQHEKKRSKVPLLGIKEIIAEEEISDDC